MRSPVLRQGVKSTGDELTAAAQQMYGRNNVLAVRRYDSAVIATVRVSGIERRLVLKRLPNRNCAYSPSRFARVHKLACRHGAAIRELFPPVMAADDRQHAVALGFQDGLCQYASLRRALAGWRWSRDTDTRLQRELETTARAMARVHRLSPEAVRIPGTGRCSASWLENTLTCITRLPLTPSTRRGDLESTLAACFGNWRRSDTGLLLGDAQPGNIIIRPNGSALFIDLSFRAGRPALDVASYLVGIDTVGLRYPVSRRRRLLGAWKDAFTRSYLDANRSCRRGEIICFYLRALARHWERHRNEMAWLRWYIDRYYTERFEHAFRQAVDLADGSGDVRGEGPASRCERNGIHW